MRRSLGAVMLTSLSLAAAAAPDAVSQSPIRIRVATNELHRVDRRLFGQFLERPSWGETGPEIAADTNGVPIGGGKARVTFPRRGVSVVEIAVAGGRDR